MRTRILAALAYGSTVIMALSADMNTMDHGPFVSWTIDAPAATQKGIAIKAAADAMICFDTDLLRISGAWTGGLLKWHPQRDGLERHPTPAGTMHFTNDAGPGWATSDEVADPRAQPYGPLPRNWGRFSGLHLNEDRVLLSYSVADCNVLELPGIRQTANATAFERAFNLTPTTRNLRLRICKVEPNATISNQASGRSGTVVIHEEPSQRTIAYSGLPESVQWQIRDGHLWLRLPALADPLRFTVWIGPGTKESERPLDWTAGLKQELATPDLAALRKPGPSRWGPALRTRAIMGSETGPLAVDTLTVPEQNPWNSWIRCTGLDFLPDGRAVIASVSGDIWLVSGIAESLGDLHWKRFATGLFQPLGVKVVGDEIFVTCRDQIHRLHDLNKDDEVDFYENFNNEMMVAENFHEYTMNLETDSAGNFYFTKGAPWPPVVKTRHAGVLFKLSPDGRNLETYATGLRGPNGLAIGPNDMITFSDNEGHWLPTCSLQLVKRDGFYGMKPTAHQPEVPDNFEKPICWIPHGVDNSPGGQVWIPENAWGPLAGKLLLGSYGKATLSLVLMDMVDGVAQGGVVRLPLKFDSGIIRGRFHTDGHLYLCGLKVWQSVGIRYGAFHRVRYTGKPMHWPVALRAKKNGLELDFGCELDPALSTDPQDYSVQAWNYRWIEKYGSPRYSIHNPEKEGQDTFEIRAIQLSNDRKTVFIEIPEMQPAMQMQISFNIVAADGAEVSHTIYSTVNRIR